MGARAVMAALFAVCLGLVSGPVRAADVTAVEGTMRTTRGANVRAEPRADSDRLATLDKDTRVAVTGRLSEAGWVRVSLRDGRTGYIWKGLLADFKKGAEAPAPSGPPRPRRRPRPPGATAPPQPDTPVPPDKVVAPKLMEAPASDGQRADTPTADLPPQPPAPPEMAGDTGATADDAAVPATSDAETAPARAPGLPAPGERFRDCPQCPAMVVVPAGRFTMGARKDQPGGPFERPAHQVRVPAPFAVSRSEVTRDQWRACVAAGGCEGPVPEPVRGGDGAEHPVARVSWKQAKAYTRWLSDRTGGTYRLPTEAQWEYMARAGSDGVWPWEGGPDAACAHGNVFDATLEAADHPGQPFGCDDGHAGPAPAGRFTANGWGLVDVIGNVAEWVRDCPHNDYSETPTVATEAWTGDNCDLRVYRGGSWRSPRMATTLVARAAKPPERGTPTIGFRVVRLPDSDG